MRCWIWRANALTPRRAQASSQILDNKACLRVDGKAYGSFISKGHGAGRLCECIMISFFFEFRVP